MSKKTDAPTNAVSRSGEVNPRLHKNPKKEHKIITRRSGKILPDDTGFKAVDYNERFEPVSHPDERSEDDSKEVSDVLGQTSMSDVLDESEKEKAPVEINEDPDDFFESTYKQMRGSEKIGKGGSEKLKAIARTAEQDDDREQITFSMLNEFFPSDKNKKKSQRRSGKNKEEPFDIDENEIIAKTRESEMKEEVIEETRENDDNKENLFLTLEKESKETEKSKSPFKICKKEEIAPALENLKKTRRLYLVKTCVLLVLGVVLLIISLISEKGGRENVTAFYPFIGFVFVWLTGFVSIKELLSGFTDVKNKNFSENVCVLVIFAAALGESVASMLFREKFFAYSGLSLPAAIISMTAATLPGIFKTDNSRLALELLSGDAPASVFKRTSESGVEGSLGENIEGDDIRSFYKTDFLTGIMERFQNAVPKALGGNFAFVILTFLSLFVSVGRALILKDATAFFPTFSIMTSVSLPASYAFLSSLIFHNREKYLFKFKSSLISYDLAEDALKTKAVVINAFDLIDRDGSNIHGVKPYGAGDPKESVLLCASLIRESRSPLRNIMDKVIEDAPVPEISSLSAQPGGVGGIADGRKVLLGSKDFLISKGVNVPDDKSEEKFITGDRRPLYFSVDGELSLLLVVSYRIERGAAAYLRFLSSKNIKIMIYSKDPNINPSFIVKKCRLKSEDALEIDKAQTSYFLAKDDKIEPALPASPFCEGSVQSSFILLKKAFEMSEIIKIIPWLVFMFSSASSLLAALLVLTEKLTFPASLFVLAVKIISSVISIIISEIVSKRQNYGAAY